MLDRSKLVFFIPGHLKKFKLKLFESVAAQIEKAGGSTIRGDFVKLSLIRHDRIPIVGCTPELMDLIQEWKGRGQDWIYWDRGYARRVFATWLPQGTNGGYYRWELNSFQMKKIRDVPDDRWKALDTKMCPWKKGGKHIVVASPSETYSRFHQLTNWTERTLDALSRVTERPIIARHKESKRPLQYDLEGAHALISHGSIAAVEAAILGCPVFVDKTSAAALVGCTDVTKIETPLYPDREAWVKSLAYSQFNETELTNGTLWEHLA